FPRRGSGRRQPADGPALGNDPVPPSAGRYKQDPDHPMPVDHEWQGTVLIYELIARRAHCEPSMRPQLQSIRKRVAATLLGCSIGPERGRHLESLPGFVRWTSGVTGSRARADRSGQATDASLSCPISSCSFPKWPIYCFALSLSSTTPRKNSIA